MKKIQVLLFIAAASLAFNFCIPKNIVPVKLWETDAVLQVPESVMYDEVDKILYVSNINGKPLEKNNAGYLSRISLDGKVLERKWITGLDAPKGMGIFKGQLFVSDINRVHQIDISKKKIIATIAATGALFLNDIAIDKQGTVYISDMKTSKIYRLKDEKINEWVTLDYPNANGMLMDSNRVLVGTAAGIVDLNLKSGKPKLLIAHDDKIDGLKCIEKGTYIVSNWAGRTELIGKRKILLLDTMAKKIQSADFEYIHEKRLLLIPTFFHNTVRAYRLP